MVVEFRALQFRDGVILQRLPDSRYSKVIPEWTGCTCVLIGGGPSLSYQQIALVRAAHDKYQYKVIAINDSYLLAPFAEVLYFADASWHAAHMAGVPKPVLKLTAAEVRERFLSFAGQKCSIESQYANVKESAVHFLRNKTHPYYSDGLSLDPTMLVTGRHGGFQAFNLAVLAGTRRIILLAMDGREAPDGKSHWHGGHRDPTPAEAYKYYRQAWSAGESAIKDAGVEVLNCSPGSAIDSFPKVELYKVLEP